MLFSDEEAILLGARVVGEYRTLAPDELPVKGDHVYMWKRPYVVREILSKGKLLKIEDVNVKAHYMVEIGWVAIRMEFEKC